MKILLRFTLLLLLAANVKATEEEDHQALRAIVPIYENAMASGNIEPLKPYLADDFSGVMLDGSEVTGYDGLVAFWNRANGYLGKGSSYRVTVDPKPTKFLSDSIGLAMGSSEDRVLLGNGKTMDFTTRWSAVVKRDGGSWKVSRLQITMDPINNPFVSYAAHFTKWMYAGAGALAGLMVGWIISRLRRKKMAPLSA